MVLQVMIFQGRPTDQLLSLDKCIHYLITKFQHLEIFHTKKIPQKFPSKGIHPERRCFWLGSGCVTYMNYLYKKKQIIYENMKKSYFIARYP